MEFISMEKNGKFVVEVKGRLDAVTATDFDAQCAQWLAESRVDVIADLQGLEYISSAGLRSILTAAKKLKGAGGNLCFSGLNGMVEEVFSVSGFSAMFTMYPTIDDALAG